MPNTRVVAQHTRWEEGRTSAPKAPKTAAAAAAAAAAAGPHAAAATAKAAATAAGRCTRRSQPLIQAG
jgi:hypothetical protein